MTNALFDYRGRTLEQLKAAINLVMMSEYDRPVMAGSWVFNDQAGLIFYSGDSVGTKLPVKLNANDVALLAWNWIQGEEALSVKLSGDDSEYFGDDCSSFGFRVSLPTLYSSSPFALLCVRPSYCYYAK